MDESTRAPSLIELVQPVGEPCHQPGTFDLLRPGWRRLRIDPEDHYWPAHNPPVAYEDVGLSVVKLYAKARGEPIGFDEAVDLARWCLHFRLAPEHKHDLHDWIVSSFFTIAGEKAPRFAYGPAYMRVSADSVYLAGMLDEAVVKRCIGKADSSRVHHDALRTAAAILLKVRQPLGDALTDWVADALEADWPCGKPGRPSAANTYRNRAIVATIERLVAEGMSAGRNEVSAPTSACDAIARALGCSYETARGIWKARPKDA